VLFLALGSLLSALFLSSYRQRKPTLEEFFLMGRSLGLPLFAVSLVSSSYTGFGFAADSLDRVDLSHFWIRCAGITSAFLIYIFLIAPRLRKFSAMSIPDLVRGLYGRRSAKIAALLNLFSMLPILYAVFLGMILQSLFGGEFYENVLAGLVIAGFYSAIGGLRSDIYADAVKFIFMITSLGVLFLFTSAHSSGLQLADEVEIATFSSFWGYDFLSSYFLSCLIGVSLIFVDPIIFQRVMAAKSERVLRYGLLLGLLFWVLMDYLLFSSLQVAKASFPDQSGFSALSAWASQMLPPGAQALFWVGVLASLLAMMDSYLLVAGTSLTFDIGSRRHGGVNTHRAGILGVSLGSFLFALVYRPSMEVFWRSIGVFWAGALVTPLLLPLFMKRRFPGYSFVVSICASFFLMMVTYGLSAAPLMIFISGVIGSSITFLGFWIFEVWRRVRLKRAG